MPQIWIDTVHTPADKCYLLTLVVLVVVALDLPQDSSPAETIVTDISVGDTLFVTGLATTTTIPAGQGEHTGTPHTPHAYLHTANRPASTDRTQ